MYESEKLNLLMQQYKLYAEQKDNFTNRSFSVNKFYLVLNIVLLVLTCITPNIPFVFALSLSLVFALIGSMTCILWWMNMDSYNLLIKIKYSKVLEEIEKQLPAQPYKMEHDAITEYREKKKQFLFTNMQKTFAIIMFIVFFVSIINSIIPAIIKAFVI